MSAQTNCVSLITSKIVISSMKLLFLDQIKHHKNSFTANPNIKINSPISHELGGALLLKR
jgi:hypothetical protein